MTPQDWIMTELRKQRPSSSITDLVPNELTEGWTVTIDGVRYEAPVYGDDDELGFIPAHMLDADFFRNEQYDEAQVIHFPIDSYVADEIDY